MGIKIEIDGFSAEDVLAQMRILVGAGSVTAIADVEVRAERAAGNIPAPEAKAAPLPKPRAGKTKEPVVSVTDADGSPATGSSAPADAPQETESASVTVPATEQVVEHVAAEAPRKLDFDKEVAPKVLGYVRLKGKPWVEEILNEFGVKRASDLSDEQLPELLDTLADRGGPLP